MKIVELSQTYPAPGDFEKDPSFLASSYVEFSGKLDDGQKAFVTWDGYRGIIKVNIGEKEFSQFRFPIPPLLSWVLKQHEIIGLLNSLINQKLRRIERKLIRASFKS